MILSFCNILYYNKYCNNYNNTIIINIIKLLGVNKRKKCSIKELIKLNIMLYTIDNLKPFREKIDSCKTKSEHYI